MRRDGAPVTVRVGLTGGVASGKSTVSAILAELGAVVIDADLIAREVVARGTPGLEAVVAEFGPDPDIAEVDEVVRTRMQDTLDELARKRRFPVLG